MTQRTLNEYRIIASRGFDSKEFYTTAYSAEDIQKDIENKAAFELYKGWKFKIEKL